jgi:hypothetical protein
MSKAWFKPQLIALTKESSDERILSACKASDFPIGVDSHLGACIYASPSCGMCLRRGAKLTLKNHRS